MDQAGISEWKEFLPKPCPIRSERSAHVFLSYRSLHRRWVLQLYDALREAGLEVYLDQMAISGDAGNVKDTLDKGLVESSGGIVVWSQESKQSKWCQHELRVMHRLSKRPEQDFRFVLVRLGNARIPRFAERKLRIDFPDPRISPSGLPLLRVVYGVLGKPLPEKIVRLGEDLDHEITNTLAVIRAAGEDRDITQLLQLAGTNTMAWRSFPTLKSEVAYQLLALLANDQALEIICDLKKQHPDSCLPKQLFAVANFRRGDISSASKELSALWNTGARDPDTIALYARASVHRYRNGGSKVYLRKALRLFVEGYQRYPQDWSLAKNVATFSALLDDVEYAKKVAEETLILTKAAQPARENRLQDEYWKHIAAAEANIITSNLEESLKMYGRALSIAPDRVAYHVSALRQMRELVAHMQTAKEFLAAAETVFKEIGVS